MSYKAKNLSYEAQEPSFLRRLRAEQSGRDVDRHDRAIARPRRPRKADDDDGPTYVDEANDTLSKAEAEALIAEDKGAAGAVEDGRDVAAADGREEQGGQDAQSGEQHGRNERLKQEVTEVGAKVKKRKAVKVVGDTGDEEDRREDAAPKKSAKPKKSKAKAIKLSFEDL